MCVFNNIMKKIIYILIMVSFIFCNADVRYDELNKKAKDDDQDARKEEPDASEEDDRDCIAAGDAECLVAYLDCRCSASPEKAAEHGKQEYH